MNAKTIQSRNKSDSASASFGQRLRAAFAPPPRRHDPMLVLSMSIFNFEHGWSRVFTPFKTHENGAR